MATRPIAGPISGIGAAGGLNTPSPASVGRYLILYAYYSGKTSDDPSIHDSVVLTINPGPNYGKVAYPVFQAAPSGSIYFPFYPLPVLPPSASDTAEAITPPSGVTDSVVTGNSAFNGLAGWVSSVRQFNNESGLCADQYMLLSVDTLLNNTPLSVFPKTTTGVAEPYINLAVACSVPDDLYDNIFVMAATVQNLFGFSFFGDNLGLIVTDADGRVADLFQDESMFDNDVPPSYSVRTEFAGGGVRYPPDVYSAPGFALPFADASTFTNGNALTMGMTSLRFNVS